MRKLQAPESWEKSKVSPGMSIGESIFHSVVEKPQERVIDKWKMEMLWKQRGATPIEGSQQYAEDNL